MPDPIVNPAATPNPAEEKPVTPKTPEIDSKPTAPNNLLDEAGKDPVNDVLSDAEKQEAEEKQAEEKRLLETPEDKLTDEEKARKSEIVKSNEEKNKGKSPEKYDFKVPEGMTLDQGLADKVTPILREMNVSQEMAQKLVDIYSAHVKEQTAKQVDEAEKREQEEFNKYVSEAYKETIEALGTDVKQALSYVARVRNKFFSKETREILAATGLSNNKHLILDLIKIGKIISEDQVVSGKPEIPGAGKAPADIMYPNQGKK